MIRLKNFFKTLVLFSISLLLIGDISFKNQDSNNNIHNYQETPETKTNFEVLFLSSYDISWNVIALQEEGINESLGEIANITIECLDSKTIPYTEERKVEFHDYLVKKYGEVLTFNLVIIGDDNALNFAYFYKDTLFNKIPVVCEGINNIDIGREICKDPYFCGVAEVLSYFDNIALAKKLFPKATNINVIFDNTIEGRGAINQFKNNASFFSEYTINYVNTSLLSLDEIKREIKSFTNEELNFYITFNEDKDRSYTTDERTEILRDCIDSPIFSSDLPNIDQFFIGGYIYSHYRGGLMAGNIAKGLLTKSVDNDEIELINVSLSDYIFNYKLLKKYNIDMSKLPASSEFLNYPNDFFENNKVTILWVSFTILISLIIIAVIVILLLKIRKANRLLKEKNSNLKDIANKDFLTKCMNHKKFEEDLAKAIEHNETFYLLMLDIDDFKNVNDVFGHVNGDKILISTSRYIESKLDDKSSLYRFGGDEFAILTSYTDVNKIKEIAKDINLISNEPFHMDEFTLNVKLSIGISSYPQDAKGFNEIVFNSDSALYYVKTNLKNSYAFYDAKKMKKIKDNTLISNMLQKAIEENKVYTVYQPVYNTEKKVFDHLECLMRIKDFPYGPADFIPVAEKTGDIIELGRIAARQAVLFEKELQNRNIDCKISINFSAIQVADDNFIAALGNFIDKQSMDGSKLSFEFTESALFTESDYTEKFIAFCENRNMGIALDDFGSGYSSMNNLYKFRFKVVKLDKTLIDNMFSSGSIKSLIALCHELKFKVVAEGVEKLEQLNYLIDCKCDYIQGFYFSKPLEINEVLEFLIDKNV